MSEEKNIHWFPGHMKRALIEAEDKAKLVDIIIEIVDARAPFSSRNIYLKSIGYNKPHLIILNKEDIALVRDRKIIDELRINEDDVVIALSLVYKSARDKIIKEIEKIGKKKNDKYALKGMKPQPIRAMVLGIPNVGKSSLINLLAQRKSSGVANTPGFTRAQQWVNVTSRIELLDTPGILPPNYEDQSIAMRLALIGAMRNESMPNNELCVEVIKYIKLNLIDQFNTHFNVNLNSESTYEEYIESVAKSRGYLLKGNTCDDAKTELLILRDFKDGAIGKVYLD
ncbi:MAG: ribosome biogenesis GTPase YlqF [Bacilli bacterium]